MSARNYRAGRHPGKRTATNPASAERAGRLAEHAVEFAAEQGGAGDDRDRDQRDQQAVLDRGGAALGAGDGGEADANVVDEVVHEVPQVSLSDVVHSGSNERNPAKLGTSADQAIRRTRGSDQPG